MRNSNFSSPSAAGSLDIDVIGALKELLELTEVMFERKTDELEVVIIEVVVEVVVAVEVVTVHVEEEETEVVPVEELALELEKLGFLKKSYMFFPINGELNCFCFTFLIFG